jgi:catechol 2,3-dioxygenase-like lactoylglutathione lyase family enzyme
MFEGFSHVMFYVADFDRALAWYRDKLGMKEMHVAPGLYAILVRADSPIRIDLHYIEGGGKSGDTAPVPFLAVKDLDLVLKGLEAKGVEAGTPRCEGGSARFVMFKDSEGNFIGLSETK